MQGAISGRLSRQVLLFAWPRFGTTVGTVVQVDDLLERVLKVSHVGGRGGSLCRERHISSSVNGC